MNMYNMTVLFKSMITKNKYIYICSKYNMNVLKSLMKKLIRMNVELKRGFLGDPLRVFFSY